MKAEISLFKRLLAACPLLAFAPVANADSFIPTMIEANILWLLVLPLVVRIEGWLMERWKWQQAYVNSLRGNLLSMLAALPVGVLLSTLGYYVISPEGKANLLFMSESTRHLLATTLFYGHTNAPSYGFASRHSFGAGLLLAALIFIGICWFVTFAVEGFYYAKKNPALSKSTVYRGTAIANLASYAFLIALWMPYSYYEAYSVQQDERRICSGASAPPSRCAEVWEKIPDAKERRMTACHNLGIPEEQCLLQGK